MGKTKNSVKNLPDNSSHSLKSKPIHKKYTKDDCTFYIKKLQTGKQYCVTFPTKKDNEGKFSIMIPKYRNDGLCFTSGFCNSQQIKVDKQNNKNQTFAAQNFEIPAQKIMIPRPSAHNSYCTICKIRFQDYLSHIKLEQHTRKMKQSSFNEDIANFSELYTFRNAREIETMDEDEEKRESLEEKERKKNNFYGKEKLYEELKEQFWRSTRGTVEKQEEIFDVIL